MVTSILLALLGAAATATGGYLLAARAGRQSREVLEADLGRARVKISALNGEVSLGNSRIAALQSALDRAQAQDNTAQEVATQVRSLLSPMVGAQRAATADLQAQLGALADRIASGDDGVEQLGALREEVRSTLAPLLQKDRESQDLRDMMMGVLSPLMERERRAHDLTRLGSSRASRHHLPKLLDMLARRGGFAAVLLSDEMGLPLGASSGARDADVLAGVSSLVFSLADRLETSGGPAPLAVLLRDASNQRVLHRIFSVGGERFLVTAVSKGSELSTDALDPALTALEGVLGAEAA